MNPRNGIHLLPQIQAQAAQQPVMQIAQPISPDAIVAIVAAQIMSIHHTTEGAVKDAVDICARCVLAIEDGVVMKRVEAIKAERRAPAEG